MPIQRILKRFSEHAYALARIVSGLMFAFHGVQKILGLFTNRQPPVLSQVWIGGIIELVCGIAVALGVYTSWAALLASGTMAVAYTQFHWKLQLGEQLFPTLNKGELALLYCVLFLFIATKGSGRFSVMK